MYALARPTHVYSDTATVAPFRVIKRPGLAGGRQSLSRSSGDAECRMQFMFVDGKLFCAWVGVNCTLPHSSLVLHSLKPSSPVAGQPEIEVGEVAKALICRLRRAWQRDELQRKFGAQAC
jgi:hypothetical protein